MVSRLQNHIVVSTIDHEGREIPSAKRPLRNTPWSHLLPDEPHPVFIDWMAATGMRPKVSEVTRPVSHMGRVYHGNFAWGSMVKDGVTLGLVRDVGARTKMVKVAEDGQRVGRWLLAEGIKGGIKGDLKIKLVKPGEMVPDVGPVDDGFGYIRRDLAETGYNDTGKTNLGPARQSYTFWQRIPWKETRHELIAVIDASLEKVSDPTFSFSGNSLAIDEKMFWLKFDPEMELHPYIANALVRQSQDIFFRMGTSVPLPLDCRLAVPTTAETAAVDYLAVIHRQPIDSWGSIQAVEPTVEGVREKARIDQLEVIQHTTATLSFCAKGCLGVVDDIPGGYDMILCTEDVKMTAEGTRKTRKREDIELENAVVSFCMWYDAGSSVGVQGLHWGKDLMGLDHDGDYVFTMDVTDYPSLYFAVKSFPRQLTKKLVKTRSAITKKRDDRADMIVKSMSNLVGMATNIMSSTFMVEDREWLSGQIGFPSEGAMDEFLNTSIKIGTDGFKTKVDMVERERRLAIVQSSIVRIFGKMAPWTYWRNHPVWFRLDVPKINPDTKGLDKEDAKEINRAAIVDWMDGTIPEIARITLPILNTLLVDTVIRARPLSYFKNWAPIADETSLKAAAIIKAKYDARRRYVNFSSTKSIESFRAWLIGEIKAWRKSAKISKNEAAAALWRVSHSSRSDVNGAALPFMAMPEQAELFIKSKPGLLDLALSTVITGLPHQFDDPPDFLEGPVKVVSFEEKRAGKRVIRTAVCGEFDGQHPPKGEIYPEGMIGAIAKERIQPPVGDYEAVISRMGTTGAWAVKLVPA